MKHKANVTRDRAIGQAYFFGKTRKELANEYGLSERRISQIIAQHRATMRTPIGRRDAFRAMRWSKPGRPRDPALTALNEDDRKLYGKIMRSFGAAYAREAMGLRTPAKISHSLQQRAFCADSTAIDGCLFSIGGAR